MLCFGAVATAQNEPGVKVKGNVFGGGKLAEVGHGSKVTLNMGSAKIGTFTDEGALVSGGDVYGGGEEAKVGTSIGTTPEAGDVTVVNILQGTVGGNVYGGGLGVQPEGENPGTPADVHGAVTVTVNGGTVTGSVFGCNNLYGAPKSTVTVNIEKVSNDIDMTVHDVYGGGNQAAYTYSDGGNYPAVNIKNGTVEGDVFGGGLGSTAKVKANPVVTVGDLAEGHGAYQAVVTGNVYGGGSAAQVGDDGSANSTTVLIQKDNTAVATVFGGGKQAGVTGNASVTLAGGAVSDGLYGGCDAEGTVVGDITVNVAGGTVGTSENRANIHGGGLGHQTATSGNVTVTFGTGSADHTTEPTLYGDLYGGSGYGDVNDAAADVTTVNVLNGEIHGDVYGGGLGKKATGENYPAKVNGTVAVNIGSMTPAANEGDDPTYGGKARISGSVFGCNNVNGTPQANVVVNIYQTDHYTTNDISNECPDVTTINLEGVTNIEDPDYKALFALQAVYGGGNKANYEPLSTTSPAVTYSTTVHVWRCNENTIHTVYGGGNAADVGTGTIVNDVITVTTQANTNLIVDGGRFDRIFGGGNGYSATGNHDYPNQPNYNPGANIFGTASTEVKGGAYRQIFGASNQRGDLHEVELTINKSCDMKILESFGGANEADLHGDVVTNLMCSDLNVGTFYGGSNLADIIQGSVTLNVYGGTYDNVFGGSKGRAAVAADPDNGIEAVEEQSADIDGAVTLNLFGGTIGNAFGGSNILGAIKEKITVNVLDFETDDCGLDVTNIYGAGNLTGYNPTNAATLSSPEINLIHGTVKGSVYGGGKGGDGFPATVTSNPTVNIGYDATLMGTAEENTKLLYKLLHNPETSITYSPKTNSDDYQAQVKGNVYGGGEQAVVQGGTEVTIRKSNTLVDGNVFGGGNEAGVSGTATVTLANGTVKTGIYGGCNAIGNVAEAVVTLTGGTVGIAFVEDDPATEDVNEYTPPITADVFGGGLGNETKVLGNVTVNIGVTNGAVPPTYSGNAIIYGDVYGGSAKGLVNCNEAGTERNGDAKTDVTLNSGTIYGDLYGGGLGQVAVPAQSIPAYAANVWGPVTVTVNGGKVDTYSAGLYQQGGRVLGCNNYNGAPQVSTLVEIKGGEVASSVFGGGNLADVTKATHVIVRGGTVNEVYGGGAFASTGPTVVDILAGTTGDIYGGCLGGSNNDVPYSPSVNGNAIVNIGSGTVNLATGFSTNTEGNATIGGSVFGGNNTMGSPTGIATVNIYKTAHTDGTGETEDNTVTGDKYAIMGVYGGGNVADFTGTASYVNVYGCDNTIERVFGGGNAASTNTLFTMIQGGRMDQVFGGGNGYIISNDAADVNGNVNLSVHGGTIRQLFGCGNEVGTISGAIKIEVDGNSGCSGNLNVDEFFGGSNLANIGTVQHPANLSTTIGCNATFTDVYGGCNLADITGNVTLTIKGSTIANVYAGSKGQAYDDSDPDNIIEAEAANISGNVTLNIYGGAIGNAFGGSNINGNIGGNINVVMNWDESECGQKSLNNLYGASNLASYTPTVVGAHPEVNIIHGTVSSDVFGGGLGETAIVTGNPVVNINGSDATVSGSVYGGGSQAATTGDPEVTLTSGEVATVYGGGKAADVTGNPTVNINGGTVSTGIYGGCDTKGTVTGDIIIVNITSNIGASGSPLTEGIFGGGKGGFTDESNPGTSTNGNVTVNIMRDGEKAVPILYADVYGGSAFGQVGASGTTAKVNLQAGTVNGTLYGGGKGDNNYTATVSGNTEVAVAGNVTGGVYGGCNVKGIVNGDVTVGITSGTIGAQSGYGSVYGGGLGENTKVKGSVAVTLGIENSTSGPTVNGDVYGGSAKGLVNCNDAGNGREGTSNSTAVTLHSGSVNGSLYGGGHGLESAAAHVWGPVTVAVTGGTVNNVFGCNNANGAPKSDVAVNIGGGMVNGDVFGGGNLAGAEVGPVVTVSGGEVKQNVFGGGNEAGVGAATVNINGGTIGTSTTEAGTYGIYGGCNTNGNVAGAIAVNINAGVSTRLKGIFGGGFGPATTTSGRVDVVVNTTGTVNSDIYGGSAEGWVNNTTEAVNAADTTKVTLTSGTVVGDIYGGGLGTSSIEAKVWSPVKVAIGGGTVTSYTSGNETLGGNVFGCNNVKGAPQSTVEVNMTDGTVEKVFGGGNLADANTVSPVVTVSGGTVTRSVYGGGNKASVGATTVNISDGLIGTTIADNPNSGVYGGCNASGTVNGAIELNITGGTFGTAASLEKKTDVNLFKIFGGGFGQATSTTGNVTVNYGTESNVHSNFPRLYGELYGGSALGTVNPTGENFTTTLNILNGSFPIYKWKEESTKIWYQHGGSIYGGGLGDKSNADRGQVNGVVHVNVGKNTNLSSNDPSNFVGAVDLRSCKVFGCNNANGSPQKDVYVDVYKTMHERTTDPKYNDYVVYVYMNGTEEVKDSGADFAIGAIYGGGNEANYAPPAPDGGQHSTTQGAKTHVFVHGCENTAEYIYGGGNAADAIGVVVQVEGGHFGDVFGGGNGLVSAANVGAGGQGFKINAGIVNYQYEGCNMQGSISGDKYVPTPPDGGYWTCHEGKLIVQTWFFGGNEAEIYQGLDNTITCEQAGQYRYKYVFAGSRHASIYGDVKLTVEGGNIENLFGGSKGYEEKPAHIKRYPTEAEVIAHPEQYPQGLLEYLENHTDMYSTAGEPKGGNIHLIVRGGKIGNIFGGNDLSGNVEGEITIEVEDAESSTCPLSIDNIYGGSNLAEYDPVDKTITSPVVKLYSCTVGRDDLLAAHPDELHGNVFGGGKGSNSHIDNGVVTCNPKVLVQPKANKTVWVKGNVYGGGYLASVGDFTRVTEENQNLYPGRTMGTVLSCAENTGKATVIIDGGTVGPRVLKMPDFRGHVFGGGKGVVNDSAATPYINFVNNTEVIIGKTNGTGPLVKGSVYGGAENGHVLNNTSVKIQGGQIGCGWDNITSGLTDEQRDLNEAYDWNTTAEWRYECNSWPYEGDHAPYDKFAQESGYYPLAEGESQAQYARGGKPTGTDGHTFYGNVFGGGSGYFPKAPGQWLWSAGAVYGNTHVDITGGHILTSVYGGNELTNVVGDGTRDESTHKLKNGVCKVTMRGGTLGVPRTEEQIKAHPVTCYLFGGGKGDQRSFFYQQTNVDSTYVEISGNALIYGSIFGGAEDGHVLGNTEVKVIGGTIGTRGTSYLDGNVFGGGRGFSGEVLTEGVVCGNVDIEISGGTMKGSIYGGGRLASVGTYLVPPADNNYGKMQSGDDHGHIKIAIKGNAVIGHNNTNERYGGYVFAGCMGRLYKLDNTTLNTNWSSLAKAKTTEVTISGDATIKPTIKRSVYGGGEFGFVDEQTTVNIAGGIVDSNVYGGGYGSDVEAAKVLAGRVYGNTEVNVTAGLVKGDVYGGGEMASVGKEDVAASGNTEVNIGSGTVNTTTGLAESVSGSATIEGNIFGANNRAGSPRGNTWVNIYGTAQTGGTNDVTLGGNSAFNDSTNFFQYVTTDAAHATTAFALQNVYGAGNMANYTPVSGKSANVHIYGCRNTVRTVYGGGRAADAGTSDDKTTCNVTIDGGRIDTLFAGGDGHLLATGHTSTEVTCSNPQEHYLAADIYGNVNATVNGGFYTAVFGASNTAGVITGQSNLLVSAPVGCGNGEGTSSNGKEYIGVLFGGGNLANAESDVTLTVGCGVGSIHEVYGGCNLASITGDVTLNLFGGTIDTAYGGSRGDIASLGDGHIDKAANINGDVTLNLYGGTINGEAFGGSNRNGNITGTITVNMNDQGVAKCGLTVHNIYGASNLADYTPTGTDVVSPQVNLLYGTVSKKDGVGGNVYGGAKGRQRESITYNATVTATPQVKVGYDGDMHIPDGITLSTSQVTVEGNVYGGGNLAPVAQGTRVTLQSKKKDATTDTAIVNGNIFGGGSLANVTGATTVTLEGGRVALDVYGGGEKATTGNTSVTLTNRTNTQGAVISQGTVVQDIYGGGLGESGHPADVAAATVNINGGAVRNVYGCNNVLGSPTSATVTVTKGTISQNVYGGGNLASTVGETTLVTVAFNGGSVQNVFGGGQSASVGYSTVTIGGGSVAKGVYGGCYTAGEVQKDVTMTLTGGTVGNDGVLANRADGVFGGGYGSATSVTGNVMMTLNSTSTSSPEIYGDLYGGSALGTVNTDADNTTILHVLGGTIYGDVYGGGLGDTSTLGEGHSNVAAKVKGVVRVNIGSPAPEPTTENLNPAPSGNATIAKKSYESESRGGTVYGCNNINGSPQANVYVNIYSTAHISNVNTTSDAGYALDQVFGGGNKADFTPTGKSVITHIYGCDNTIRRIFGGGNAAAVKHVSLTVDGGRFDTIWGGGNGEVTPANVQQGIELAIHGGHVNGWLEGSNHAGTITGGSSATVDNTSGCGELRIDEYFCGGSLADYTGDRVTTISCSQNMSFGSIYGGAEKAQIDGNVILTIQGGTFTNVYGGSKGARPGEDSRFPNGMSADITGNVTLNIEGGTITNVFGGSNVKGNIGGKITVNINDAKSEICPLFINNVYGGGRDASYTPDVAGAYPEVNILRGSITKTSATSSDGNVFGGGLGEGAVVTSNPVVTIGDLTHTNYEALVQGAVYGGGDKAAVTGNTSVTIQQSHSSAGTLFGGGNEANINGTTIVNVNGGTVTGGVYGGCNASGNVSGLIAVNVNDGTVGRAAVGTQGQEGYVAEQRGNVHGGGYGQSTTTGNSVAVTIGSTSTTPEIYGDVYGGSALGSVAGTTSAITTYNTNVTLNSGTVHGDVYGGGLGSTSVEAKVWGPVQVTVTGGTADSVFGCNNILGSPQSTVNVDVYGTENTPKALKAVFGGGNKANSSVSPTVTVHNCDSKIGTVYGGGNAASVPATNVTVYGGSIDTVFGGGNGRVKKAPVAGASTVKIHGGSIGQVFGGNNVNGNIEDIISVTIEQKGEGDDPACTTMEIGNVYGGGNLAVYAPSTDAAHGKDIFSPKVFIISGNIEGSVYGGGKGIDTSLTAGMVRSNTLVDMQGGTVKRSIYGGGELASVGNINNNYNGCEPGTGLTQVLISGGVVGDINNARMPSTTNPEGDDYGYVFAGGKGVVDSVIYGNANKANKLALVDSTYLEISGSALITASVYGGCENGMVLRNTHVKISGGQIGIGYNGNTWDAAYTEEQWAAAKNAVTSDTMGSYNNPFHECDHFPYGVTEGNKTVYKVYDIFAGDGNYNPAEASKTASNGHSFYGNVFGGGSGYYPFWHNGRSVWRRTAGRVKGNTLVEITGGHILTSVYGGNEYTDVLGHCTVKMSGGTLGVPRSLDAIAAHPVTCYLFGAGMGDPRTEFNTWTTVDSVYVEVSGGIIYGSVFGGGEDGHVKGNVHVVVKDNAFIGTWGTSYVDGNVFGGGRGFKGDVLTPGVVAGNVTVDISGGVMLGSVYGGGRLASVGTYLVPVDSSNYGQLMPNDGNNTHGYITVNISGGVIGNSQSYDVNLDHSRGGNVFGGCMGRLTQLDGSYILPRWRDLGKAKRSFVNISGGTVKGNVYGGSELGTVRENSYVKISGDAVIGNLIEGVYRHGNVYGGGYGNKILTSEELSDKSIRDIVPLFAGLTYGNTNVEVTGNATVGGSVFGGGDLASVGTPGNPVFSDGLFTGFTSGTGTTTVTVRGGTVGPIDANHQNGHVYGGGRGQSSDDYKAYSNVASTSVNVKGGQVMGDVYGGGADAHVLGNTIVTIDSMANIGTNGTDNHNGNVFGGGRGSGTVTDNNFVLNQTCGRVGGNTNVTMKSGSILGSIFGGGRMALVGVDQNGELTGFIANNNYQYEQHGKATIEVKGDASIGTDNSWNLLLSDHSVGDIFGSGKGDVDYYNSVEAGRVMNTQITISGSPTIRGSVFGGGEMAGIGWWDTEGTNKGKFYANTGVSTISISETPTIGTADEFNLYAKPTHNEQSQRVSPENPGKWTIYDGNGKLIHTCTGNVFGGSQGDADIESPHWVSMGRSKMATVTISGGTIRGEVFGGAEQGVMTGSPTVTISDTSVIGTVITNANNGLADYNFGSVYGGGYGSDNHTAHTTDSSNVQRAVQIAGRVYGNTSVSMTGGTVKANVYGGGSYASVGNITFDANSNMATGCSSDGTPTVTISGGTVEGNVFGSSRGDAVEQDVNNDDQAWVKSTSVTVSGTNTRVKGNVFGGGENGHVLTNAEVTINGGTIGYTATEYTSLTDEQKAQDFPLRGNVYGAGSGMDKYNNSTYNPKGGIVMGNTKVTINSGYISRNVYGAGAMASVGDATLDNTHTSTLSWPYKYSHAQNTGKAEVIIKGGHIGTVVNPTLSGDVYGSARGAAGDRMEMGRLANVCTTDVTVNFTPVDGDITDATEKVIVGSVYGSGENGHVYADATITLTNGLVGGSVFGGGKGTDTYGSGNIHSITAGKVYGNTYVNINGGRVNHNVYGGGNMASVGKGNYNGYGESGVDTANTGRCYVNIYGGTVGVDGNENGHVFGAGKGFAFVPVENPNIDNCPDFFMSYANKTYVTIGNPGDNASDPKVKGSVFGGSENGHVRYDAYVQVNRGEIGVAYTREDSLAGINPNTSNLWTFRGNVYGAGRGMGTYKDAQNNDHYNVTAGSVGRNTRIDINGGTVHRNVLGGGSLASVGQPMGGFAAEESSTCIVNINTTIGGTYANKYSKIDYGGYVGGGSRGLSSPDAGPSYADFAKCANTQVNINAGGVLPHSLYGGGEYGQVTGNTEVNILGGKVHSSIYGGGKGAWGETGHANDQASGLVQGNTEVNLESGEAQYVYGGSRMANIMGNATVNVGKNNNGTYEGEITVTGAIYGCNNKNGSPKGDATVHVWKTKRTTEQETTGAEYAIPSVFGGGHQADYSPSETTKRARVIVHGCENTIGVVYGGGDAADAYGVGVEIDGGRFNQVFGGGNGYSATDNHTNPNEPNYNPGANVGAGGTETQIHGGSINQLFGGSNAYGNISGQMNTIVDNASGCSEHIGEFFGGGNKVPISGDIVTTIGCGTVFDTVYGGSNQAGITGNVTLNIKGGTIGGVYAGSKGTNTIAADIKDNTTTDAVEGNVTLNLYGGTMGVAFGGSNINGNIDGVITVNVLDHELADCEPLKVRNIYGAGNITAYTPKKVNNELITSPVVNVMHIKVGDTISGDVFGGGLGSTAIVTANPKVTIGYDATTMTSLIPGDFPNPTGFPRAVVAGKVFGGGDLANVAGTATVRVQRGSSRVPYVYGGGNAAAVAGTQVFVSGGTITDVYGGGRGDEEKAAMVNGPGTVNISGGRIGKAFAGGHYNGGITGAINLHVEKSSAEGADALYIGELYGGGNLANGRAGTITIAGTGIWTTAHDNHNATDNRIGYELEGIGVVYGGANKANVGTVDSPSPITLTINNGIVENVYGGNNQDSTIYGGIEVNIQKTGADDTWYVGTVFGGGNVAPYGDTTVVNVKAGTVTYNVYGGGNNIPNKVKGQDVYGAARGKVNVSGGTVAGDVYGGCNTSGTIKEGTRVTLTDGTVRTVYGGGLGGNTHVKGGSKVDISGNAQITSDVFGGGNQGSVDGGANVRIH